MWIVRLALRNPYSVAVFAAVILIMGILSIQSMLIDVFPVIDLPIIGVVWNYPGLTPEEVEERVTTLTERAFSTTVQGIQSLESQSILGISNVRAYFQPGTDIGSAVAQTSAISQAVLRFMPPGMAPPAILPFNASNVPVAQLTISSDTLPEQTIFDYALNFIRIKLFTIPGLATPAPYGGATRQINIDVNPELATSKGLSPQDIINALQNGSLILPAGTARMGKTEYNILLNSSPLKVEEFDTIPVKVVGGRPVVLGDVAKIEDSHADQVNVVRINGKRATFLNLLKKSDASTLRVVNAVKEILPDIKANAPKGMKMKIDFDQSTFVQASVNGVIREALIAVVLVSLMILFFLGSWQSIVIVCTSIPLSIFAGIVGLKLTGNSLNIMTLGGLSLAIGMLVDDATVEVENINRNAETAPSITIAVLRGAHQIALPAIVSTLAICIVFYPVTLLTGAAKFLFTPLAEAVVFSMLISYILSRTLVPVLSRSLLKTREEAHGQPHDHVKSRMERFNDKREHFFERLKQSYGRALGVCLKRPRFTLGIFVAGTAISLLLPFLVIGTDFYPETDAGLMKFHFRAPPGTRVEETEKLIAGVEERIRKLIPESELETINSTIGTPTSYNLAFVPTDNSGEMDAEVLVALSENHHPTKSYVKKIRTDLAENFPSSKIYFQPADIVSQVLNFGLSAPVDIQIEDHETTRAYGYARRIRDLVNEIPGAEDVIIKQSLDYPSLKVNVDRVRAAEIGLSQKDVATSMLNALASSTLVSPSFYVNPSNGVNYSVVVKEPLKDIKSVPELLNTPITAPSAGALLQQAGIAGPLDVPLAPTQTLGNLVSVESITTQNQVNHHNVQRVIDVTASVEDRDLGSTVKDIEKAVASLGELPAGTRITVRGQADVMRESFTKLGIGVILAALLVYLLMVILFQSWLDPFIIMIAVPGALTGVLLMLAVSGTSINVVSLMGAIMAIGIAVSNSNLLVNFANDFRIGEKATPANAALEAGMTRLRPVLMTALAMILGMLPTSLGIGEGSEQNAPLGRAVIGGLLVATLVTLFIVPVVYSVLRKKLPTKYLLQESYRKEEVRFDQEESP
jgi:multidrug efflux pump subunit AcrB